MMDIDCEFRTLLMTQELIETSRSYSNRHWKLYISPWVKFPPKKCWPPLNRHSTLPAALAFGSQSRTLQTEGCEETRDGWVRNEKSKGEII